MDRTPDPTPAQIARRAARERGRHYVACLAAGACTSGTSGYAPGPAVRCPECRAMVYARRMMEGLCLACYVRQHRCRRLSVFEIEPD